MQKKGPNLENRQKNFLDISDFLIRREVEQNRKHDQLLESKIITIPAMSKKKGLWQVVAIALDTIHSIDRAVKIVLKKSIFLWLKRSIRSIF